MTPMQRRMPWIAWAATNLVLVFAACAWWGWLDWQYVERFWTEAELRAAVAPIPVVLAIASMAANLWLLRRQNAAVHIGGSLLTAIATVALWWGIIAVAGAPFHAAIGGDRDPPVRIQRDG
jgi:hypothetical protein